MGYLCYAKKMHTSDKFGSRAVATALKVTKGYILYDLTKQCFFVIRDVTFNEAIFPFRHKKQQISHLSLNEEVLDQIMPSGVPMEMQPTVDINTNTVNPIVAQEGDSSEGIPLDKADTGHWHSLEEADAGHLDIEPEQTSAVNLE